MTIKPTFRDLSVPGLRNIFLDSQPLYKSLLLIVVILLFCGLSIFQITERILYYASEPVSISYRFEVENKIRFPSVSICPYDGFNTNFIKREILLRNVSNVYELVNAGLNLNEIWELTGNNWTDNIINCRYSLRKFCVESSRWKRKYSLLGLCYTLEFDEPYSYSGFSTSLLAAFQYEWTHEARIVVHDIKTDIVYAVFERGIQMVPKTSTIIYYNFRRTLFENVTSRPCYDLDAYNECIRKCYDDEMLRGEKCRLPFISAKRSNLTLCSTSEDFEAAYPMPYMGTAATLFTNVKLCKKTCGRPCVKYQYDITVDSRNTNIQDNTRLVVTPLREGTYSFTEQKSYSISGLFCDIGAVVGLYLGISVLTLVEFIEIIYFMVT